MEESYCKGNSRPSEDPVVLYKIVIIQHLLGIPSLRRTMGGKIKFNVAYRWFLGYALSDELSHFSTVSYNFRHRFTSATIEQVFQWLLYEADRAGCLAPEAEYIDGTHIKADANIHRKIKQEVSTAANCLRQSTATGKTTESYLSRMMETSRRKGRKSLFP